jgi:RimJ/RimL family protein N-acetyltransferase
VGKGEVGEFLGSIGLSAVDRVHGFGHLGYWVRSGRMREGIGAAAVRLVADDGCTQPSDAVGPVDFSILHNDMQHFEAGC